MATINLPFAASATRRAPTSGELADGFPCGAADIELFNWLGWYHTGQIGDAIEKSGLTQVDNDTSQLARAVRSQKLNYIATVGGTPNDLTATLDPAPASYNEITLAPIRFIAAAENPSASPTINFNGLGALAIKDFAGNSLGSRQLKAGALYEGFRLGSSFHITSTIARYTRTSLFADTTFYVNAATGNDNNDGLSAGSAFATISAVAARIHDRYDLNGFRATVQVADGTYTAGAQLYGSFVGASEARSITFVGNTATPANCIINSGAKAAFQASDGCSFKVRGFTFGKASAGSGVNQGALSSTNGGRVIFDLCRFAASADSHIYADNGTVYIDGNYTIAGGAAHHVQVRNGGQLRSNEGGSGPTVTLSGTPAFSVAFALVRSCAVFPAFPIVFSGAATGSRYLVGENAVINTTGGGPNFLPGNAVGSAVNGGQYV